MWACFLEVRILTLESLFPRGLLLFEHWFIPASLEEFRHGQDNSGVVTLRKAMRAEAAVVPSTPQAALNFLFTTVVPNPLTSQPQSVLVLPDIHIHPLPKQLLSRVAILYFIQMPSVPDLVP